VLVAKEEFESTHEEAFLDSDTEDQVSIKRSSSSPATSKLAITELAMASGSKKNYPNVPSFMVIQRSGNHCDYI